MSDGPFETTFRVGEVIDAEAFPEARTAELVKLWIDLGVPASDANECSSDEHSESDGGRRSATTPTSSEERREPDGDETVQSAAQLGWNYDVDELPGRQVLCATDLGEVPIGEFTSEVLTVGVPDEAGNPVLVAPDEEVPLGGELY